MATVEIQCGSCKFNSKLDYDLAFPPIRVCDQYTNGVPDYVSTTDVSLQKPCSKYEEKQ